MQSAELICPPHHWLITEQDGPFQHWRCLRCGEAKEQARDPSPDNQSTYHRGLEQARLARQNKKGDDKGSQK
jgi:hypothetical protein